MLNQAAGALLPSLTTSPAVSTRVVSSTLLRQSRPLRPPLDGSNVLEVVRKASARGAEQFDQDREPVFSLQEADDSSSDHVASACGASRMITFWAL